MTVVIMYDSGRYLWSYMYGLLMYDHKMYGHNVWS